MNKAQEQPRIGGMALKNGLVLVSERYWAAAIRELDGTIKVASGRKVRLPGSGESTPTDGGREQPGAGGPASRAAQGRVAIPLMRGLGRFGETLLVMGLVKTRLPNAQLPFESGRIAAALVGSAAATSLVKAIAPKSALVEEVGSVLASLVPAVLALKNSPVSGYHGAEHKVIGGARSRPAGGFAPPLKLRLTLPGPLG